MLGEDHCLAYSFPRPGNEMMKHPLGFVLVVEAGALEKKALLLLESIREFAGPFRRCPIWAVQPRLSPGAPPEPLPGWYDFRAAPIITKLRKQIAPIAA